MSNFFKQINYSAANEDGFTERQALAPQLTDKAALTITGSGSRALELSIANPSRIVSIDFNPTQNFLLELKIATIKNLEYEDMMAFIGLDPSNDRLSTYEKLKSELSSEAQSFWDKESEKIKNGILYCGTWETYLKGISKVANLIRRKQIDQLLKFDNLKDQQTFWDTKWDNLSWKLFMHVLGNRGLWKYVIKEPGIHLVPNDLSIAQTIKHRFDSAARNVLFKEAAFSWLILKGKYQSQNQDTLPCHLQKKHFQTLKNNIGCIELKTEALDVYLDSGREKFNAFSISDFGSYAPLDIYERIWLGLKKSAHKDAKICEREFLVPHSPEKIQGLDLSRDTELEKKLTAQDKSFIYKFIVGTFH